MTSDAGATHRLTARVQGRVQGVGFRYFVRTEAHRLGLDGWVRNERDGSVAVVAEGSREDLERFADRLRKGPPGAAVRDIRTSLSPGSDEFAGFEIRYF